MHILAYISLKLQNVATLSSVALLACNYSIILLILHVHVSIRYRRYILRTLLKIPSAF